MSLILIELPDTAPDFARDGRAAIERAIREALPPSVTGECDHAGSGLCERLGEHVWGLARQIERADHE